MTTRQIDTLRRQFERAVYIGDRVAEINLRNRIAAAMRRELPAPTELELRWLHGDR